MCNFTVALLLQSCLLSSDFGTVIGDVMFAVNTGQVSPPSVQTVKVRNSSSAAAANKQLNPAGAVTSGASNGGAAEAEIGAEAASNSSKKSTANKNTNDSNGNSKKSNRLQSSNADR